MFCPDFKNNFTEQVAINTLDREFFYQHQIRSQVKGTIYKGQAENKPYMQRGSDPATTALGYKNNFTDDPTEEFAETSMLTSGDFCSSACIGQSYLYNNSMFFFPLNTILTLACALRFSSAISCMNLVAP